MNEADTKFVKFHRYCRTCKNYKTEEYKEPCNECLEVPARLGTEVPLNYERRLTNGSGKRKKCTCTQSNN